MGISEVDRLEALWAGPFGQAYLERNRSAGEGRGGFWQSFLDRYQPASVLEVGSNIGGNLRWVAGRNVPGSVVGLDIYFAALTELRAALPGISAVQGQAVRLPFRDGAFDLVFTTGVLIHQPPDALPGVMREIVRCSRRYVLCCEYFAEEPTTIPYRGQTGALFKRDFGALYLDLFPGLVLREQELLSRADGWDNATYWLFEK